MLYYVYKHKKDVRKKGKKKEVKQFLIIFVVSKLIVNSYKTGEDFSEISLFNFRSLVRSNI